MTSHVADLWAVVIAGGQIYKAAVLTLDLGIKSSICHSADV